MYQIKVAPMLFVLLFTCSNLSAGAQDKVPTLNVSASAELRKLPDTFNLTLGVVTLDRSAQSALAANREKMQSILKIFSKMGLSQEEISTNQFTVSPQVTPAPKNPPENWTPTLLGYEVRNSVQIRTGKLDLMEHLVEAAAQAGGNLFQDISFSLDKEQEAKEEAIGQAIDKAQEYAAVAARQAGVSLGAIVDLTVNQPFINTRLLGMNRLAAFQDGGASFSPGSVEITASVSISYQIN